MAKKPIRRAAPQRRATQEPRNPSRGAGEAAPASPAATGGFYAPDGASPAETLSAHHEHIRDVRAQAVNLDVGLSGDAAVVRQVASGPSAPAAESDAPPAAAEIERIRKLRKPLGAFSQKLALPVRRGYHRHWFNDTGNRVAEAEANGWTFIKDQEGRSLRRAVGTGRDNGVMYAYAMELPEVFWLEDMDARNTAAQDKMDALKRSPIRAEKGKSDRSDSGKFYSPSEEVLSVEKH